MLALFAAMMMVGSSAWAQNLVKEDPFIEVNGTHEMEVVPDEIYITITLREKLDNKSKLSVDEQEKRMRSALQNIGIDLKDLLLSDAKADFIKLKWQKNEVVNQKQYVLKVANAETVGKVYGELDRLDIKDAYISRVDHSKMEELKKQAKIMAMKNAKEKADYLTAAVGYKATMPLQIREDAEPFYPMYATGYMREVAMDASFAKEEEVLPEIEFKKIKLKGTIYAKFKIEK